MESEKWRVKSEEVKIDKLLSKLVDFWRRRKDLNLRAGCPTYTLSRGASSPLEYFSIKVSEFLTFHNIISTFFSFVKPFSKVFSSLTQKLKKIIDTAQKICYNWPRPDIIGVSPSGKAKDFDSFIRKFESCYPCQKTTNFDGNLSFLLFHSSLFTLHFL